MVLLERREVMAMAAAKGGIFLEEALLDIEAELLGLDIGEPLGGLFEQELVIIF